ncbi:hypothetical protein [Aquisediminimonas sediminicola]|nr:hypothetical protein [Aquisediminimonas sediminicola]
MRHFSHYLVIPAQAGMTIRDTVGTAASAIDSTDERNNVRGI